MPGDRDLSQRLITRVMAGSRRGVRRGVAVRPRDHGAAPFPDAALRPAGHPGQHQLPGPAARAAASRVGVRRGAARAPPTPSPERIAIIGTGGISHWPATPDSGKINEAWDREFLDRWVRNDRDRAARLRRSRRLRRGRPGRLRDPHVRRRQRRRGAGRPARCTSTRRSRSSPSAARSPPTISPGLDVCSRRSCRQRAD